MPKTRPNWNRHYVGKIFAVGLPFSFASIVFSLIYMAISPIINRFGPSAIVALGRGHRIESVNYMLCSGLFMACITMIAHNLGAGYFERAKATALKALSWCFYLNTVTTLVGGLINFGMFFMGWWHKPLNQVAENAA